MALDINKLDNKKNIQVSQQQDTSVVDAKKSSSKPIDLTSKNSQTSEKEKKENIYQFINSPEYLECKDSDKLELLKSKFPEFAKTSDKVLTSYLDTIKKEKELEKESTKQEETTTAPKEETKESKELANLANRYFAETKSEPKSLSDLVDELTIKSKTSDNLTETEQKIIDAYNKINTSNLKEVKEIEDKTKKDEQLFDINLLMNEKDFESKNSTEKANILIEQYLEQTVENYDSLSKEEQIKLLKDNIKDIEAICAKTTKDSDKNQETTVNANLLKSIAIMNIAKKEGVSLEELKDLKAEDLNQKIIDEKNEYIKYTFHKVLESGDNDIKNLTKLYSMALSIGDPEYAKLTTDEEKQKRIKETMDNFIRMSGGVNNFSELPNKAKIGPAINIFAVLTNIIDNPDGTDVFERMLNAPQMPKNEQLELSAKFTEEALKKETDPNKIAAMKENQITVNAKLEIYNKTGKIIDNIEDYQACCEQLIKEGNASDNIIKFKEKIDHILEVDKNAKNNDIHVSNSAIAINKGREFSLQYLHDEYTKGIKNGTIDKKELLTQLYNNSYSIENKQEHNLEEAIIDRYALELGFTKEEIAQLKQNNKEGIALRIVSRHYDGLDVNNEYTNECLNNEAKVATKRLLTTDARVEFAELVLPNKRINRTLAKNIGTAPDKEIKSFFKALSRSNKVAARDGSRFTKNFITGLDSDERKVQHARAIGELGNAAMLEGAAAASKSVSSPEYRSQYDSTINDAAQNYPPETQARISEAISSGEISRETQANNSPITESYNPIADMTSGESNTQGTSQATQGSARRKSAPASSQPQGQTTQQTPVVNAQRPAANNNTIINDVLDRETKTHQTANSNSNATNTNYNTSVKTPKATNSSSTSSTYKTEAEAIQAETKRNEEIKSSAMENAKEVQNEIEESILEWAKKEQLDDETIEFVTEIANSEEVQEIINKDNKQEFYESLRQADSISEFYNILLDNLGSKVHEIFIETLASRGSSSSVRSFIKSKSGDTELIKEIYKKTKSGSLKAELLDMLPSAEIITLLNNNAISDLRDIDPNILFEYVSKNISSMTSNDFKNYIQFMSVDQRAMLNELWNKRKSTPITPIKEQENEQKVADTATQVNNVQTKELASQKPVQNTPVEETKKDDKVQQAKQPKPQTTFKANETIKQLNDGRVITSQGTTFAGISNNDYDEFREVKKDEGAPVGMNDEVLTPGSQEWLMKYNKQQQNPTTKEKVAFTMSAMENDDEEIFGQIGSDRVSKKQPIKRKYRPQNFGYRA